MKDANAVVRGTDAPNETRQTADLRDYLAAERTFLAWIRTGLALMGFGFVVARFGLFLQQLRLIGYGPDPRDPACRHLEEYLETSVRAKESKDQDEQSGNSRGTGL